MPTSRQISVFLYPFYTHTIHKGNESEVILQEDFYYSRKKIGEKNCNNYAGIKVFTKVEIHKHEYLH